MHRQTGLDTPAFPPDRPAPTEGRYHRPGEPWPLYASLDPATAWAEWSAATRGAIEPATERRRLWRLDADRLPVIDLRRSGVAAELGVKLDDLIGPRSRAHALAERAREAGAQGMIVPSAAQAGAWNLVVFPGGFSRVQAAGSRVMNPRPPTT